MIRSLLGQAQWLGEKGFVGGTRDASTGLTHLGAREYDPRTGRFISVDPIIDVGDPQQMHGYAYANNSPVSFTDPDGLKPLATGGGAEEDAYWKSRGEKLVQDPSSGRWSVVPDPPRKPRLAEPPEVTQARRDVERAKQIVVAVAKELGQILMDELGITDAVDCFINGDMGACAATALNVVLTAVGGAAGKLIARYGLKPWKLKELGDRLWNLGGKLKDAVGTFFSSRRKLDDLGSCPVPNSFVPGTLVLLADGSTKPIEQLDVGDLVLATDPETGETAVKMVVATITGDGTKGLVEITVDTDRDRGDAEGVVVATDGHPFWVPESGEWRDAAELEAGQWLQTSAGTWVQITAVRQWTQTQRVHNLTIDDIHTYYVVASGQPVLVHNCRVLGDVGRIGGWIPDTVPSETQAVIRDLDEYGLEAQGAGPQFAGPDGWEPFENSGRNGAFRLPSTDGSGRKIEYQEHGTVQSAANPRPGGERIVRGSDGSMYYSPTHYQTYIVVRAGR
ncbi:polymorphic toxin-type HINT domain-containing protein [Solwaraspora sp. WMMD406]|uniref:polymorphic toxin-type HINT domain-containing protein n=1 Tax=Solwaraspora sp. WMMD406 TaxID=3016095 RepID=UPI00241705D4|nr:polymorphic toxin-type HINT domain-containing protein [Solwaraspora sp. WMMD406]MDG4763442.1 polymorphic toxin-type HINT domain-containing protein [Solwaraspora sp. WMMD406]